jgi:2-hydroxy-3-oxopropionate reductase
VTTVGFIGLGIMGLPMATNLVVAGYDVVGFNRTPTRTEVLVGAGGRAAGSIAECVSAADVVAVMVPDSADVEAVVLGENGVFANARPDTLVVDFSTIRPDTSRHVGALGLHQRQHYVDAPVSGGEQGAITGTLAIMVGGTETDFAAARPLLDVVGQTVVHVGPLGSGQVVKAANQLLVAGIIELVAEAMVLIERSDVDLEVALQVLRGGLAGNAILERKASGMLAHDFAPGFRLELHHKDLGIVHDTARKLGVYMPLGALVGQLVGAMVSQGHGSLDHSALLQMVEQLSGVDATHAVPQPAA